MNNPIVLATLNSHKVEEIKNILGPDIPLNSLAEIQPDYGDVEETGQSFQENACIKAKEACMATGLPALADDSGLEIQALDGEPGIYSSRFEETDELRIRKVLDLMKDVSWDMRKASFRCVVCYYESEEKHYFFGGKVDGYISFTPLGDKGFGYDPVFYHPPSQKTFAQLPPEEKNRLSHRYQAFCKFKQFWKEKNKGQTTDDNNQLDSI